jgi:hypothetical protein
MLAFHHIKLVLKAGMPLNSADLMPIVAEKDFRATALGCRSSASGDNERYLTKLYF